MIYREIFFRLLKDRGFEGTLVIRHEGKTYRFGSGPSVSMDVKKGFFRRVILYGDIGLGEAYFNLDMETDDLKGLLTWFVRNKDLLPGFPHSAKTFAFDLLKVLSKTTHLLRKNTRLGSRKNIRKHYDVSNRFYSLWLDPTMTYSCAVFGKGMTLEEAQLNKYKRMCRLAGLRKGDHVLEIGTGWGGFSIYAARELGARVTTVTISKKQYALARGRIHKAGLDGQITLKLLDYRDIKGRYDRIVSIEMMEALGHEYVPLFMRRCAGLLAPGGAMAVQVITFPDEHFKEYLRSQDYIKKHIFPGGELLSVGQIRREAARNGLLVTKIDLIGREYAKTLSEWSKNFARRKKDILALGFDERFYLKWLYYFIYCEVGFETDYIGDAQIALRKA